MTLQGRRRWLPRVLVALLAAFIAVQFVPYGHARVNPAVVAEPDWDSPVTRSLAKQACFDCHSNETEWPLYSRVAPVSWLIRSDVDEGRAVLNFSEWQRPQKEASEAAEKLVEGEMPLAIYKVMHAHARLNEAERTRLAQGLGRTIGGEERTAQDH